MVVVSEGYFPIIRKLRKDQKVQRSSWALTPLVVFLLLPLHFSSRREKESYAVEKYKICQFEDQTNQIFEWIFVIFSLNAKNYIISFMLLCL